MATARALVLCSRCGGTFHPADDGAVQKTECPFCGFANVVAIIAARITGTQRTADSQGDASAATGITVT